MFNLNNTVEKLGNIIEGTAKNLVNIDSKLYQDRILICRTCPLIKNDLIFGEICNPSLYVNPSTLETSNRPKKNFVSGCGCILRSKLRVKDETCVLKR